MVFMTLMGTTTCADGGMGGGGGAGGAGGPVLVSVGAGPWAKVHALPWLQPAAERKYLHCSTRQPGR